MFENENPQALNFIAQDTGEPVSLCFREAELRLNIEAHRLTAAFRGTLNINFYVRAEMLRKGWNGLVQRFYKRKGV
jgi:hypothetical protein